MERIRLGRRPTSDALTAASLARKEAEEFNIQATHSLVDHVIERGGPLLRERTPSREGVKRRQRRENGSLHHNIAELLDVSMRTLRHYQSQPSAAREAELEAARKRSEHVRAQRIQGHRLFDCGELAGAEVDGRAEVKSELEAEFAAEMLAIALEKAGR